MRRAADGHHLYVGQQRQQVWLINHPLPNAAHGVLIPLDNTLPQRLAAAAAFWRMLNGKPQLRASAATTHRRSRLILGLRALDGREAGASYRELAQGIFGVVRVPDGRAWKTHDLRSRVVRLVADASALRDGGYRVLLRSAPAFKP